jgi:hypothetical protein
LAFLAVEPFSQQMRVIGHHCPSEEIVRVPFLVPNENGFTEQIGDPWIREAPSGWK